MRDLVIFGASTLAKLASYYATSDMRLKVLGFVVDAEYKTKDNFMSRPVYSWPEFLLKFSAESISIHMAIGYRVMRHRAATYERLKDAGYEMINIISQSSFIANDVSMGDNNFVMPGVVLEPGVSISSNNIVWSNATICHDSKLGSHNFIAANATIGGETCMGNGNFLGFSSVILQGRTIGDEALIGAQSLLLSDVETLSQYHGSPAVKVRDLDPNSGIKVS